MHSRIRILNAKQAPSDMSGQATVPLETPRERSRAKGERVDEIRSEWNWSGMKQTTRCSWMLRILLIFATSQLTGCSGGYFNFSGPDGQVQGRFDPQSGNISIRGPNGIFDGRWDPYSGSFRVAGPEGSMSLDANPYGAQVAVNSPNGNVLIQGHQNPGVRLPPQPLPPLMPNPNQGVYIPPKPNPGDQNQTQAPLVPNPGQIPVFDPQAQGTGVLVSDPYRGQGTPLPPEFDPNNLPGGTQDQGGLTLDPSGVLLANSGEGVEILELESGNDQPEFSNTLAPGGVLTGPVLGAVDGPLPGGIPGELQPGS